MSVSALIERFRPLCAQEERDRESMLSFLSRNPDSLSRANLVAHFTASAWVVSPARGQILFAYHRVYDSWAWLGGHADGDENLARVALREAREESGSDQARLARPDPISLEILPVNGHEKHGLYVPAHLHLNLTYLIELTPEAPIRANPDESKAVRWFPAAEALASSTEKWMVERVYAKLMERMG